MAGVVLIGSVPEDQIVEFQAGERERLDASRIVRCSEILASWVTVAPLNRVLQEAIDSGQSIRADLWHPGRLPGFHTKVDVGRLKNLLMLSMGWSRKRSLRRRTIGMRYKSARS